MDSLSIGVARCPDISTCRAKYSGVGDLFYCQNEERVNCDFPLSFGDKFFCRHPQNIEIAAWTAPEHKP